MNAKEQVVRDFYAARNQRDWDGVRALIMPDVSWRESDGNEDYGGAHHGRETVAALLAKFVEVTGGTFTLEPREVISTADHAAASVRWQAERKGIRVEGNDLAIYRIVDGKIAEAWFCMDGYDPQALSEVFSFATSE